MSFFSKEMREALLIIDAQKIYSLKESDLYIADYERVIERINMLITFFEKKGKPIIYIRHIHDNREDSGRMFDYLGRETEMEFVKNTEEVQYIDELLINHSIPEITKTRYSSFVGTKLDDLLKQYDIECVLITGFMTNYCCETTARHAHDLDYYVKFIIDATSTPGLPDVNVDEIKKITASNIANGFGVVCNTTDILF